MKKPLSIPTTHNDFETISFGKWILAGEHAVLRGSPVIIFPLPNKILTLSYTENEETLRLVASGEYGDDIHLIFWGVLEHALEMLNKERNTLRGQFQLDNQIPLSVGMGASAALCVAVSRWILWQKWIKSDEVYQFAKRLEDLFHGESSGADIAACLSDQGILFQTDIRTPIETLWKPKWYLSYCDKTGVTAHCIKKVKELWKRDIEFAKRIDEDMRSSVLLAKEALSTNEEKGFPMLVEAINRAKSCFERWGLSKGSIARHINQLTDAGALATKPTGSGDGGYVLSIWARTPPNDLPFELLKLD